MLANLEGWKLILFLVACSGTGFALLLAIVGGFVWLVRRVGRDPERTPSATSTSWIEPPR